MPEYLAPDVYVEEIDTGSKPIEGVSTSTAAFVGVAERGPVDVPILVTSYGEYTRWFGDTLNPLDYPDHCFLPPAVEGFFTNGGKRLYVIRVVNSAMADRANTILFGRTGTAAATTTVLGGARTGATTIVAINGTGFLAPPQWVQIGDGSTAEFRETVAPMPPANDVALRMALKFGYQDGAVITTVDHFPVASLVAAASAQLDVATMPGDTSIRISGAGAIVAGQMLRLGTDAAGDDEYVFADAAPAAVAPAPRQVLLRTPVALAHPGGAGNAVDILNALPAVPATPAERTFLDAPAQAGQSVLFLNNRGAFATAGDVVRISGASRIEVRRLGQLGEFTLGAPAYELYPAGATVEAVTLPLEATVRHLNTDAKQGDNFVDLDNIVGLAAGSVIQIGLSTDVHREFLTITDLPGAGGAATGGKVLLSGALQKAWITGDEVRLVTAVNRTAPGTAAVALAAARGNATLITGRRTGFGATSFLQVQVSPGKAFYHFINAAPTAVTPTPLTLNAPLNLPHLGGEPLVVSQPLFDVDALDAGAWGNRLRVAVHDSDPPLVRTMIRTILDSTHLRLVSANGIEAGTVLERTDAAGIVVGTFKVIGLERQSDFLITLDAATPLGGAAVGDAINSREFQLDVFLLRQPDPAVPSRSDMVLASESFPNLSMDSRHSRYIHKVIGTTWGTTPGLDDDGNPLRKADLRSEGSSWFIRVFDGASAADKLTVRLGPKPLTDTLPSGVKRPARLRLTLGNDAIGALSDATYVGTPNIEPEQRTGLFALENEEDISIVACPGQTGQQLQGALIAHCEYMRYRFAVLDGPRPPKDSLNDAQNQRQNFDSKYAAFYHPWVVIPDPYPMNLAKIPDYPIPPSGHMIGIYARTDIERGVHKAPANEVVRGVIGLQRRLNKGEHDILNPYPVNINVIRDFRSNSRGIRVYGGRVITSDPDWKYVNVRRLLIFIEASINRGLQWVVFEPNAEPLWSRVRRSISNFLTLVWRNGGLEGAKVEEAFFVKCDRTTMTQTDIDSGRLICVVGVAPVKPAEFVIVRIGLWTAHADD
ncbi:MAG: phage tail sheath protein [Betaproteobacteria bacterium]|nr:phage tail sheath protein [Betaproteobacteria bacterium]